VISPAFVALRVVTALLVWLFISDGIDVTYGRNASAWPAQFLPRAI